MMLMVVLTVMPAPARRVRGRGASALLPLCCGGAVLLFQPLLVVGGGSGAIPRLAARMGNREEG